MFIITILIIALTCVTSISAFNNPAIKQELVFYPYRIKQNKEWYRFVSAGFVHGDWQHLFLNMLVLYLFGTNAEIPFTNAFGKSATLVYILLYILGIILSSVFNFFRHKDNYLFASLGASGAVSAIIFSTILLEPFTQMGLLLLPIKVPGFIFGLLYLLFSMQMARQESDNVDHYGHFYGAIFGFIFPIVLKPQLFIDFIHKFTNGY